MRRATAGIDPTEAMVAHARKCDPRGDYRIGRAEALDFPNDSFDLVVSYLTLIDIPDVARGIAEMARVLRPGGTLLIANINSFATAGGPEGWVDDETGERRFFVDDYLTERVEWYSWSGIKVQNWHRPLGTYMSLLLAQKLELRHFDEPAPQGGNPADVERYMRQPGFMVMEWQKPAA